MEEEDVPSTLGSGNEEEVWVEEEKEEEEVGGRGFCFLCLDEHLVARSLDPPSVTNTF